MTLALGSDLGGTKIEIVALAESGEALLRRRRGADRRGQARRRHVIGGNSFAVLFIATADFF